jgi:hypothetical protein
MGEKTIQAAASALQHPCLPAGGARYPGIRKSGRVLCSDSGPAPEWAEPTLRLGALPAAPPETCRGSPFQTKSASSATASGPGSSFLSVCSGPVLGMVLSPVSLQAPGGGSKATSNCGFARGWRMTLGQGIMSPSRTVLGG